MPIASAQDGRAAVEAFVARFSNVQIGDVVIDQNLSLYHPDGQRPYLSGEQRMFFKVPQRQRVEQTLDGQREIQITVGNKVWVRRADGRVVELPAVASLRALPTVLVPVKRRAEELLDEWRAGLNPTELKTGIALVEQLRREGRTIIIVEHVMDAIRSLCDRCVVMNGGVKIAEGTPREVLADREVIRAYLGDDDA